MFAYCIIGHWPVLQAMSLQNPPTEDSRHRGTFRSLLDDSLRDRTVKYRDQNKTKPQSERAGESECRCACMCVRFRSGLSVLGAGEVWMSVSLITGIGEKVRPSRLTTARGGSACVYVWIWVHIPMCLSYSYLCLSVRRCVYLCVCVWWRGRVGQAWGRNWFSGEGEEMRRKRKMAEGRGGWEEQEERNRGRIEGEWNGGVKGEGKEGWNRCERWGEE